MWTEIKEMQDYLEITTSEDPNEICERLCTLNVYIARSSRMLAEAKAHRRKAERDVFAATPNASTMPANTLKKYLEVCAYEWYEIEDALESLYKSCVHTIDSLRSLLSYTKEDMRLSRTGN
jgi:hypothetical protein